MELGLLEWCTEEESGGLSEAVDSNAVFRGLRLML